MPDVHSNDEWNGILDREILNSTIVGHADPLADAAKAGDWEVVFRLTDGVRGSVNSWRVGGRSFYTPLHQAAWHGASTDVVDRLVARGAWRTVTTADGLTPLDIAKSRGHVHLLEPLSPTARSRDRLEETRALDERLRELIDSLIRPHITARLRYPQTSVLTEGRDPMLRTPLWFPVPGMVGGFAISLVTAGLRVTSWSRMAAGSGKEHLVTRDGTVLVDEGFVRRTRPLRCPGRRRREPRSPGRAEPAGPVDGPGDRLHGPLSQQRGTQGPSISVVPSRSSRPEPRFP
jgi:hypothetical protein